MLTQVLFLLVLFQAKHFWCDFILQTDYHLGKFRPGWDFVGPLASHAAVHAYGTAMVLIIYDMAYRGVSGVSLMTMAVLAVIDLVAHFCIDRFKASPRWCGRWKALSAGQYVLATASRRSENRKFWSALGMDQALHHMTHYFFIWYILR